MFLPVIVTTIDAGAATRATAATGIVLVPGVPISVFSIPVALIIIGMQIGSPNRLAAQTLTLLVVALLAYISGGLLAKPDWQAMLWTLFIPTIRFDAPFLMTFVAMLGTTVSPYRFFWWASQELDVQ